MSLLYRAKKYISILLVLLCASHLMLSAESSSEKYNSLIKSGSATDIKKALLSDSELILTRIAPEGDTLLMKAIEYNRTEAVISLLIKAGISTSTKNRKGQDALMYVCKFSQDPAVIKLIFSKSGSERSLKKKLLRKDKAGNSAWDYANQNRGPQAAFIAKKYVGTDVPAAEVAEDKNEQPVTEEKQVVQKSDKNKSEPTTEEKKTSKNTKPEKSTGPKGKVQKVEIATETQEDAIKVSGGKVTFSDDGDFDNNQEDELTEEQQLSQAPVVAETFDSYEQQFADEQMTAASPVQETAMQAAEVLQPVKTEVPAPVPAPPVVFFDDSWEDEENWEDDTGFIEQNETAVPDSAEAVSADAGNKEKIVSDQPDVPAVIPVTAEIPVTEEKPAAPEEETVIAKSSFSKKSEKTDPVKEESKKVEEAVPAENNTAVAVKTSVPETPKKINIEVPKTTVSKYSGKKYLYDYEEKKEAPVVTYEDSSSNLAVISNPDKTDKDGRTELMKAVKAGNDWEIKSLIKSGANVNLQDKDGWTALMYSVRYQNNIDITNTLLKNGADTRIENKYGTNALSIAACYSNNPEIVRKLLKSYPVGNKEIFKAFVLAISSNSSNTITQIAKLNVFIETGIPMNRFYEGKTPLMYAAEYADSTDIIQLLLKNGALPSIRSSEGKTAFNFAEYNSQLEHNEVYWSLNNR